MKVIFDSNIAAHAISRGLTDDLRTKAEKEGIDVYLVVLNVVEAAFTPGEVDRNKLAKWNRDFPFIDILADPTTISRLELSNDLEFEDLLNRSKYDINGIYDLILEGRSNPDIYKIFRDRVLTGRNLLILRKEPSRLYNEIDNLDSLVNTGNFERSSREVDDDNETDIDELLKEFETLKQASPQEMDKQYYEKLSNNTEQHVIARTMHRIQQILMETNHKSLDKDELMVIYYRMRYISNTWRIAYKVLIDIIRLEGENTPSLKNLGEKGLGVAIDIDYSAYIPYVDLLVTEDGYLRDAMINGLFKGDKAISLEDFISKYC